MGHSPAFNLPIGQAQMRIFYYQSSGLLSVPFHCEAITGYSGHGMGLNNPAMQDDPDIGPIPQGEWAIGAAINDPMLGAFVLPLTPQPGTNTFGRSGFFCHGDEIDHAGLYLASHGCIILARPYRELLDSCPALGYPIITVIP